MKTGVASRHFALRRPIIRPFGPLTTVHWKVVSNKEGLRCGGLWPHIISLRDISHSRPITRRSAPPSPNREGSRCGGFAAFYKIVAARRHHFPLNTSSRKPEAILRVTLKTVHRLLFTVYRSSHLMTNKVLMPGSRSTVTRFTVSNKMRRKSQTRRQQPEANSQQQSCT